MRVILKVLILVALLCRVRCFKLYASDPEMMADGANKACAFVVYTSMTVDQMQKTLDAFKGRYTFIRTTMFRAVGERLLTKIMPEAQPGKHDFDLVQAEES